MPESLVSNVRMESFCCMISRDQERDDRRYEYMEDHTGPSDPSGRKHLTSAVFTACVDCKGWNGASMESGQFLVLG